ncbi:MAG: MFS transporter [Buchnera aphidicola (Nurudea yanoniella)]
MQLKKDIENKKKYIKKGTENFFKMTIGLFLAGFSTFSILYCVQPILFVFSKSFFLTPAESSLSLSSSTAMMAIGMLFTGPLSDKIGRKKVMASSLLLAAVLTFLCSEMNTWTGIILMRSLTGLALSGVTAIAMTYLSEEVNPNDLSLSMGLYISGNTIGGFFGRFLSSVLVQNISWKIVLKWISFLSFFLSILFLFLLPNSRNFHSISLHPKKIFFRFFLPWKHPVLSKLFAMGFILMGSFITVFNYIGYRLLSYPFFLSQDIISTLSVIYLVGVYSSPKAGILIKKYKKSMVLLISVILMIFGIIISEENKIILIFLGLFLFSAGFFSAHSIISTWIGLYSKNGQGYISSIYLFSYYLGSSVLGTIGGFFWIFQKWLGISIFLIIILLIGIILVIQLNNLISKNKKNNF